MSFMAPILTGAGGGGKGASGGGTGAKEAPNTLQSVAIARVLDLISEGPIRGLVGGDKGVYFDLTPYQAQSGSYNFKGATVTSRLGTPSQSVIPGFEASSTVQAVNVEVKHMGDPYANAVIRRISDLAATSARVTITLESLYKQDTKTGDLNGHTVSYAIDVKADADNVSSAWVERVFQNVPGKTTSAFPRSYKIELTGVGPWDIRVRRVSTDDATSAEKSKTFFTTLGTLKDYKLNYPNSALIGSMIDASIFGNQIPSRSYLVDGLLVKIPSNYNPDTRIYTGTWDGLFTTNWTNNPAWVLYDLLTNPSYGLGDVFSAARVEKWDLYAIAQYCDGWNARSANPNNDYLASGKHGVPNGVGGFEPRFTFNGVLNTNEQAYEALTALAGMFRSSLMWSGGKLRFVQDSPSTPLKVFSPANVIDGMFNYTGTALRARHTVCKVTWVNPEKNYESDVVMIEDPEGILRYGYNVLDITAYGCTSYGQAVRQGKYALVTERLETDSVQFRIGIGEADLLPGALIKISDPSMTTAEWAGRMKECTATTFTFDRPITFDAARTYTLNVVTASGALVQKAISNPGSVTVDTVTVPTFGSDLPVANAMWAIDSDTLAARTFRLMSIGEDGPDAYKIFAVEHAKTKFDEVEFNLKVPDTAWSDLPSTSSCLPAADLRLTYGIQGTAATFQAVLDVDWKASPDPNIRGYIVGYQFGTDNWQTLPEQTALNVSIPNPRQMVVRVVVVAISQYGVASKPIGADADLGTITAVGRTPISQLYVLGTTGAAWSGRDLYLSWKSTSLYGLGSLQDDGSDPHFKRFRVQLKNATTDAVLKTYYTTKPLFTVPYEDMVAVGIARSYKFSVQFEDLNGNLSNATTVTFSNPVPALISHVVNITPHILTLKFAASTDPDFAGTIVWMSTSSGFTPGAGNKVWEASGNPAVPVTPLTTYYYRYAQYDDFGQVGSIVSGEFTATTPAAATGTTATYSDGTPIETLKPAQAGATLGAAWGTNLTGKPTNLTSEGVTVDEYLKDPSAWDVTSGGSFGAGADGEGYFQGVSGFYVPIFHKPAYTTPIDPNAAYEVSIDILEIGSGTATGTNYLGVRAIDAAGNEVTGTGAFWMYFKVASVNQQRGVWETYSVRIGKGTSFPFPSNATKFGLVALTNYNGQAVIQQVRRMKTRRVDDISWTSPDPRLWTLSNGKVFNHVRTYPTSWFTPAYRKAAITGPQRFSWRWSRPNGTEAMMAGLTESGAPTYYGDGALQLYHTGGANQLQAYEGGTGSTSFNSETTIATSEYAIEYDGLYLKLFRDGVAMGHSKFVGPDKSYRAFIDVTSTKCGITDVQHYSTKSLSVVGGDTYDRRGIAWTSENASTKGSNRIFNGDANMGLDGWAKTYYLSNTFELSTTAEAIGGERSFALRKPSAGAGQAVAVSRAIPVIPGQKLFARVKFYGSTATGTGFYFRIAEAVGGITEPLYIDALDAAGAVAGSVSGVSGTDLISNGPVALGITAVEKAYTVPAGIYWVSIQLLNWTAGPASLIIDDVYLGENQLGADVTAASQVAQAMATALTVAASYTGVVSSDALALVQWSPTVVKGGVSVKGLNTTNYALSSTSGGTFAVDNTNGSSSKGLITISAITANEASGELTITVDGIAQPKLPFKVTKNIASAPSAPSGTDSETWLSGDMNSLNGVSYVAITTTKTVTLASGQSLYGSGDIIYYVAGNGGIIRTMTAKWQYAVAGSGSWNDFAAGITGSSALSAIFTGAPDYEVYDAEPGVVNLVQTKSGLGAGNYDIRVVAVLDATGRVVTPSGTLIMEAKL